MIALLFYGTSHEKMPEFPSFSLLCPSLENTSYLSSCYGHTRGWQRSRLCLKKDAAKAANHRIQRKNKIVVVIGIRKMWKPSIFRGFASILFHSACVKSFRKSANFSFPWKLLKFVEWICKISGKFRGNCIFSAFHIPHTVETGFSLSQHALVETKSGDIFFLGREGKTFFILTFPQPVETAVENCTFSVQFCGYAKLPRIIPPISTVQTSWKIKVPSGVTLAANVLDDILYQLL